MIGLGFPMVGTFPQVFMGPSRHAAGGYQKMVLRWVCIKFMVSSYN